MRYLILLILLVSGCATNSNYQNKLNDCLNLDELTVSCKTFIKEHAEKHQNGAILIGFLLRNMDNKGKLGREMARVLSIRLKNVENGKYYNINLSSRYIGMKLVEPGTYCLSKVTTYENFSINLCSKGKITVNPGEIKNAGYWLAGINYNADEVTLQVFDTNAKKIDLYEDAIKFYDKFHEEKLNNYPLSSDSDSIVGYWYTAERDVKTYLFKDDGSYYKTSELFGDSNLTHSGNWDWSDNLGKSEQKNKYSSFKMIKKNGNLHAVFENKKGLGGRWTAYRNPIRHWDLGDEYGSAVVQYDRSALEKVANGASKSVFIKINFSSYKPKVIPRVGKKLFKRPHGEKVLKSNVSSSEEKLILDTFYKWRFSSVGEDLSLTICMINGEYPEECLSPQGQFLIFELGKKYPVKGMGF